MNRRLFLKFFLAIPVLGSLGLFFSPFVRYLRPSLGPIANTTIDIKGNPLKDWKGQGGLVTPPDMPKGEKEITFSVDSFPSVWSFQDFNFTQKSKEYTFQHFQTTKIPGYVVRIPDKPNGEKDFMVVSRICPHMGCVFNFLDDPKAVSAYNYAAQHPMFACPCHLSVYDPLQKQDVGTNQLRGKVVSGPAPRPPRRFEYSIKGDNLLITSVESGGIS
ncbi:MAG: ubiquinol-cytochrome c reductase iron-sulfur subunit [Cyanobacteria bacterium]|nr:ubiquinol-cytochrome c reductase iron-sulfur subunit [Cyanobacteriota bacterium]